MPKRIFFKSVKSDGTSLYAKGRFKKTYKVGKSYRFSKQFPAFVFTAPNDEINSEIVYGSRPEASSGNRVMICYGELEEREVPRFEIDGDWRLNLAQDNLEFHQVSTNFVIIGEILPVERASETTFRTTGKVIGKFKKTKNLTPSYV